jgi:hypothetical protein
LTIPTLTNYFAAFFHGMDQVIQLSAWETLVHVFLIVLLTCLPWAVIQPAISQNI